MKKKNLLLTGIIGSAIVISSFFGCKKDMQNAPQGQPGNIGRPEAATTTNGKASDIPAYYDSVIHTIHFVEFSSTAEANLIAHNKSINLIYQSDPGLPGNQPFISVINALPGGGPGFNPVWREVQITFINGFT
jgi:hypothetical protein